MIDCPNGDVRDVLPDYVNDGLDAHARAEVERHLETCAACRDEVALLRGLRATLRRAPAVDVGAISAAIPPYRAPVSRGWSAGWRTAAAIAAIAVGGTSIALLRDDAPTDRDLPAARVARASAPSVPDSTPAAPVPSVAQVPVRGPSTDSVPAPARARELALAGAAIGDLSDGELSALMDDLESLDALPSAEVEGPQPLTLSAQEES
jgi:hypothetical protein